MVGVPNLHVLVVDPDVERRAAAAGVLRSANCRVEELAGAREAVEACRRELPAVVLIDEDACRADDLRMIDALKRDPDLFSVGVVVRSRKLDVDDALDGLARGAHGMLVDPVADGEIVASIRSAARTGVLQEELRSRAIALERLAFTDALSDIPNRRFLDRQLDAHGQRRAPPRPPAVGRAGRHRPLQAINDTYGHAVGDAVIAEVARRLGERLRTEDHIGRFGGEEFLALLPETEPDGRRRGRRGPAHGGLVPRRRHRGRPDRRLGQRRLGDVGGRGGPRARVARRRGALRGQAVRAQPGLRRG